MKGSDGSAQWFSSAKCSELAGLVADDQRPGTPSKQMRFIRTTFGAGCGRVRPSWPHRITTAGGSVWAERAHNTYSVKKIHPSYRERE